MAPTIRPLQNGDVPQVADVLHTSFGEMERWDEERVRELMGQSGPQASTWWLVADGPRVAGCVRVHAQARADAYVIRELAVRRPESAILNPLLGAALESLAQARATLVRASTPDVPPYPEAYRRRGFVPVRRSVTMAWDLSAPARRAPTRGNVAIVAAARHPSAILAELYVEGMRPYWDWYIDERGGVAALKRRVADHFASGPGNNELWLVAEHDGEPVGLAGASQLDADEAVLEGVYVLPEHRGRGIGSALMDATLARVSARTERLVVFETVTFLVGDTPSVRMYRRSGARLRAEYVHLQADWREPGRRRVDSGGRSSSHGCRSVKGSRDRQEHENAPIRAWIGALR